MSKRIRIMVAAMIGVALLATAPAANAARGGNEVIREGACSGRSDWKLKVKTDNGRLELEYEVDQSVNGQTWRVRIERNGSPIFVGTRVTHAPSGSFEVRRRPTDAAGVDRFVARATNASTGETCVGRLRF